MTGRRPIQTLPPLREVIARHGLTARRSLGQHFLLDTNLTARIARVAEPLDDRHAIEVGPGPGGLTRALLASGATDVTAVEIDRRAVAALHDLAQHAGDRLRVIEADALRTDVPELVPPPRKVVANLPYNIASLLLVGWLRQASAYESLTLMFQQEVADRICAEPGTSAYGRLSVLSQWTCGARIVLRIPPDAFTPPPKVWSAVVLFVPRVEQPEPVLFSAMERLTAAAFGQRRKMLRGALRPLGGEGLLRKAAIAPDRRAERLSIAEFDRLARMLV